MPSVFNMQILLSHRTMKTGTGTAVLAVPGGTPITVNITTGVSTCQRVQPMQKPMQGKMILTRVIVFQLSQQHRLHGIFRGILSE